MSSEPSTKREATAAGQADAPPRRSFLIRALAVAIGGIASLFPPIVGLAVFFDPLRSRSRGKGSEFLYVTSIKNVLPGEPPKSHNIIDDRSDAWSLYPEEPVGTVYLMQTEDGQVRAFNVVCPHAGCFIDFNPTAELFQCPCHDSSFALDGSIANQRSPSPRGMDELEVDPEKLRQGEVWVKFENFRPGTSEKIVEA